MVGTEFVGRERELKTLTRMWSRDTFQMMVLYGRRPIGKTALLDEFAAGIHCISLLGSRPLPQIYAISHEQCISSLIYLHHYRPSRYGKMRLIS